MRGAILVALAALALAGWTTWRTSVLDAVLRADIAALREETRDREYAYLGTIMEYEKALDPQRCEWSLQPAATQKALRDVILVNCPRAAECRIGWAIGQEP